MKTDIAEDVLALVRTVAGLPREEQNRILKLVELFRYAPFPVQRRAQAMLRELIDAQPATRLECSATVDEIIEYLQRHGRSEEREGSRLRLFPLPLRGPLQ